MQSGNKPAAPACALGRWVNRDDAEALKARLYREEDVLVVSVVDRRLTAMEQGVLSAIGRRLYSDRSR